MSLRTLRIFESPGHYLEMVGLCDRHHGLLQRLDETWWKAEASGPFSGIYDSRDEAERMLAYWDTRLHELEAFPRDRPLPLSWLLAEPPKRDPS